MLALAELLDEDATEKLNQYVDNVLMRTATPLETTRQELTLLLISAIHDGVPRPVLDQLVPRLEADELPSPHDALLQSIDAACRDAALRAGAEAARQFTRFLAA
jgi:hypothetical protein